MLTGIVINRGDVPDALSRVQVDSLYMIADSEPSGSGKTARSRAPLGQKERLRQ